MDAKQLKLEAYQFCQSFIDTRLHTINKNIANVQEGLTSETKSSAGDKHETGRAQLQLEREKLGVQLAEAQKMNQVLAKVSLEKKQEKIGIGTLVITSNAHYFISISAGLFNASSLPVYCISIATPIGQILAEKTPGDQLIFNGQRSEIREIY